MHGSSRRWLAYLVAFVVVVLALTALGETAGRKYNPFVNSLPANARAKAVLDAARAGPLTDSQFDEAVTLLASDEGIAQLMSIAVLRLEAERDPERKPRAVVALQGVPPSADPGVRQAAATALGRLRPPAP